MAGGGGAGEDDVEGNGVDGQGGGVLERVGLAGEAGARRAEIRVQRERLERLSVGDPGYAAAVDAVLEATAALIDCEEEVPERLGAQAHRRVGQVIYPVVGVAVLVGVVCVVLVLVGVRSRWWLIPLVLFLLTAWGVAGTHHAASTSRPSGLIAPVLLGICTVLVAFLVAGVISAWWTILALVAFLTTVLVAAPAGEPAAVSRERV